MNPIPPFPGVKVFGPFRYVPCAPDRWFEFHGLGLVIALCVSKYGIKFQLERRRPVFVPPPPREPTLDDILALQTIVQTHNEQL